MSIQLYGNTIWNTNVSNSDKLVILAYESEFNEIINALENTGLNYCAYINEKIAHIAVNKSDIEKIQRLNIKYNAVLPPSKNNRPSNSSIIGNIPYKNIENKEFRKYDIDFTYKLAQRLSDSDIGFSGRIYKKSATITIDEADLEAFNKIVTVLKNERSVFERNGNIFVNDIFVNDSGADNSLSANSFDLFISEYNYSDEQKKVIAKSILPRQSELPLDAFNMVFKNTNNLSPAQLSILADEFISTYKGVKGYEYLFVDSSRLMKFKRQFQNEALLSEVSEGRGYSMEQMSKLRDMTELNMSKDILNLLDYTFTPENMERFKQEYQKGNYRGMLAVIADVKHSDSHEIEMLINSGEYLPETPTADVDVIAKLNRLANEHEDKISSIQGEHNTIVINAFAGPGAGKTTSCLEIAERLKKQGYVTEYVQEYAKELVYDNKHELLDGSFQNQFNVLKEQLSRVDRLYGKVDFIVTDSPILLNVEYLKEPNDEYVATVLDIYNHFDNFNYFVERDVSAFENEGRIHNLKQSLQIDEDLKNTLSSLGIEYSTYNHSTIEEVVSDVIEYKNKYSAEAQRAQIQKAQKTAEQNGLPFSEKLSEGLEDEINPHVYDGSMTSDDFYKMQTAQETSITLSDIETLRNIEPRKSVLNLSEQEISTINKWKQYAFDDINEKSPFFRAESGDWRESDNSVIPIIDVENKNIDFKSVRDDIKSYDIFRGTTVNTDTGWTIQISRAGLEDTVKYGVSHNDAAVYNLLYKVNEIIKTAVLLDSNISERNNSNKAVNTAFMHKLYNICRIDNEPYLVKSTVEEFFDGRGSTLKRLYNIQDIKIESLSDIEFADKQLARSVLNDSEISVANLFAIVKTFDKNFYLNQPNNALAVETARQADEGQIYETSTSDSKGSQNEVVEYSDIEPQPKNSEQSAENNSAQENTLQLKIGITESSLLRDFMYVNYPDGKIPFALGNALLGYLDEKQHIERDFEGLSVSYYDKTDFEITAIIDGKNYGYIGRFDIGDGKENGNGTIIESIENHLTYLLTQNPYSESDRELSYKRDYLNVAIPYFKEHSQLNLSEQKIFDDFKKQNPIITQDKVNEIKDKLLKPTLAADEEVAITDEFFNFEKAWHNVDVGIPELAERYRNGEDIGIDLAKYFMLHYVNSSEYIDGYGRFDILSDNNGAIIQNNEISQTVSWSELGKYYLNYLKDTFIGIQNERVAEYPELKDEVENLTANIDLKPKNIPINELAADVENGDTNFTISEDIEVTGAKTKFQNNINAISVLKTIEKENRTATDEEKRTLSLYSGWGGLAPAFDDYNKRWSNEYQALKEILTEDEYSSARASTLDAFYTSTEIIDSIYKALENMGFKGGDILEPAMGIGNFFGRLPDSMQSSELYGVEKDSLTGRIAQKLYPQANIIIDGFENTAFQDNSFDVTVGNIPFASDTISYKGQNLQIHDYFFTSALDKVRAGGIVAFVTSKGTLDKKDSSFREALAEKAELLGAIRLPNNAFKSAGTEVTSDIIFLQKRSSPPKTFPDWIQLGENQDGLPVNNYFVAHPEMILGKLVQGNKMYGRHDDTMCVPFDDISLPELLNEAVQSIKGEYKAVQDKPFPINNSENAVVVPDNLRSESYFISGQALYFYGSTPDGSLEAIPAKEMCRKYSPKYFDRAKAFIELREIVRDLLDAQQVVGNDSEIKDLQHKLNFIYDGFYEKYGLIHSQTNRLLFCADNSYPLLSSLEEKTDKGKLIKKSAVFTQRVNRPAEVVEQVDTAQEALAVSINEKGRVDLAYMSSISDISQEGLVTKLQGEIYPVPELSSDDNIVYQTASEYLSGDIYSKLDIAMAYVKENPIYESNCEALTKAIPTPLKAGEIDINLGATWIDINYYQQFMYEVFQTPNEHRADCPPRFSWQLKGRRNIEIEYSKYAGKWNITNASADKSVVSTKTFGAEGKTAYMILESVLNLNDPKAYKNKIDEYGRVVFDDKGKPVRVLDVEATKVLQQKANAIRREFKNWIFKDPQRRNNIVDTYNRTFNCIKPREYDGSHMTFPGMNSNIELHEHQKNAIAHAIYGGNTLFAHSVGAGKTYEMIATAMESKRLGFCNKSMFVVPNHLTEQVGADFLKLYPKANILVATKNDFIKENRQRFMAKIATGNYDAVIIGHSQLTKLPISPERQETIYKEQISDVINGIKELKEKDGSSFQVKAMERTRKSLEKQLEKLQAKGKDNTVYFEELGIDKLFVDEAHEFKNLLSVTKLQNVSGISSRASQRATELFMKCRYLDEKTGGKGVVFATGTPISNSVTELHTMMRYLQYDFLAGHNNMQNFDNWVSSFGVQKTDYELAPAGNKFKERTRIAEYANLPELMSMFKQAADIRTTDTLNLNVPECDMHIVNVEPTDLQIEMVEELSARADDVNLGNVDPTVDNMLKITSDGRKLGLDPRLIDPDFEDNPNTKLNVCVNNTFDIYCKTSDERLTQIIFCDLGVPKSKKNKENSEKDTDENKSISEIDSLEETGAFCIYDDIKKKLIAKGVPANEIAFIHDANTEQQKSELFAKVRSGEVRILLGSTGKMGTGTNVQDRIIAMHDLDVPWRPSDLEQRRGRMVRQGNINDKVHLFRYVTKGTFDAYSYQILEKKQKFISQIMTSKTPARRCTDVDQEALTYSEIKALCTGDERIKEKLTLENRVKELTLYKSEYTNTRYELEDKVNVYPGKRSQLCKRIDNIKTDIAKCNLIPLGDDKIPIFSANIGGVQYTDRAEAAKALGVVTSSAKEECNKGKTLNIGEVYGFTVELKNIGYYLTDIEANIVGAERYTVDFTSSSTINLKKIEKGIFSLDKLLREQKNELNKLDIDYESAMQILAKPFEFEDELKQKTERLEQITSELNSAAVKEKNNSSTHRKTNYFGKDCILSRNPQSQEADVDNNSKEDKTKGNISL